jgi:hypothetical protein
VAEWSKAAVLKGAEDEGDSMPDSVDDAGSRGSRPGEGASEGSIGLDDAGRGKLASVRATKLLELLTLRDQGDLGGVRRSLESLVRDAR